MAKEFFVRFGFTGETPDQAAEKISSEVNATFMEINDPFIGRQLIADECAADKIIVSQNYYPEDDLWLCEEHKECPVMISATFSRGSKDTDNEMKARVFKGAMEKTEGMVFIDMEGRDPREFDPKEALKRVGIDLDEAASVLPGLKEKEN